MTPGRDSRYRGALLALACGDALGTSVEFMAPGTFPAVTGMRGGGPHELAAGQWTDDTSMALCLAESLLQKEGFDPADQLERYLRWYRHGYLSATGRCFDIGDATREALERFEQAPDDPYPGEQQPQAAGNAPIMRLAPIPLAFARDELHELAVQAAGLSALTTHGAPEAIDATRYLCGLMLGALAGESVQTLLGPEAPYEPYPDCWTREPLHRKVVSVARGSFRERQPPAITGREYILATLEAALWAIWTHRNLPDAVLAAVNLGEDADTVGAVCGQLAGAIYGDHAIPEEWLSRVTMRALITRRADDLLHLCVTGRRPAPDQPVPASAWASASVVEPEDEITEHEAVPGAAGTREVDLDATEIGPGVPVLMWATSKRRGGEYWQRGMVAVAEPLLDPVTGTTVVWVAWLVEYAHAHAQGRPPRAEPWPAHLVVVDPKPPSTKNYAVPEMPPARPADSKMRDREHRGRRRGEH